MEGLGGEKSASELRTWTLADDDLQQAKHYGRSRKASHPDDGLCNLKMHIFDKKREDSCRITLKGNGRPFLSLRSSGFMVATIAFIRPFRPSKLPTPQVCLPCCDSTNKYKIKLEY